MKYEALGCGLALAISVVSWIGIIWFGRFILWCLL